MIQKGDTVIRVAKELERTGASASACSDKGKMKVKKLIKELNKCDPQAEIVFGYNENAC